MSDTKASVYITEDAVTLISDDLLAIRQNGRVEVWSEDGEIHMGNLRELAFNVEIRAAAKFWLNGYAEGIKLGHQQAQAKLRAALGIDE